MNLAEVFALLALILSLLSLIVEVVRLTVEVMEKIYQKKNDDNKKDRRLNWNFKQLSRNLFFEFFAHFTAAFHITHIR